MNRMVSKMWKIDPSDVTVFHHSIPLFTPKQIPILGIVKNKVCHTIANLYS